MNPTEQQARATAVSQLRAEFQKLEEAVTEAYHEEHRLSMKAVDVLRSEVAGMLIAEAERRAREIEKCNGYIESSIGGMASTFVTFLTLPWWKRWLWCIFGAAILRHVGVSQYVPNVKQQAPSQPFRGADPAKGGQD